MEERHHSPLNPQPAQPGCHPGLYFPIKTINPDDEALIGTFYIYFISPALSGGEWRYLSELIHHFNPALNSHLPLLLLLLPLSLNGNKNNALK